MSAYCSWCSCLFVALMNSKDKNSVLFPDILLLCMELRLFQDNHLDPYLPAVAALAPHILLSSIHFIHLSRQEAEAVALLSVLVPASKPEGSNRVYFCSLFPRAGWCGHSFPQQCHGTAGGKQRVERGILLFSSISPFATSGKDKMSHCNVTASCT